MRSDLPGGYVPRPIETDGIELDGGMLQLLEALARNAHDAWAAQRLADGWTWGAARSDERKEHPGLVTYEELSESEKEYDRILVRTTLRAIVALGYRVVDSGADRADHTGPAVP
jgi:hypothetical protein